MCGGMEYLMIIFCDGWNVCSLFGVIIYEIGYVWFLMVVNMDECCYFWMDEGFNIFINGYDIFVVYDMVINGVDLLILRIFFGCVG